MQKFVGSVTILLLMAACAGSDNTAAEKANARRLVQVVPDERQIAWQELGFTAFLHFGPNTFTNREWGDGKENPAVFNPTALDTDQWCETLKNAGFKAAILTAKHHDGFCLWDTKTTSHNVMRSAKPVDVVKRFVDSCEKYGLRPGLYLSPWDENQEHFGIYGDNKAPWTGPDGVVYQNYSEFFIAQLEELLGTDANGEYRYGKMYSMWFDGAKGSTNPQTYDWRRIFARARELQPDCVLTNVGPDAGWIGNEAAEVLPSHWSVLPAWLSYATYTASVSQQQAGLPPVRKLDPALGSRRYMEQIIDLRWFPLEADVSIRPGWFFHANESPKDRETLLNIYERCAGGNVQLLLNIPPDTEGKINALDAASLNGLGGRLRAIYGADVFPDAPDTNLLSIAGVTVRADSSDPKHPVGNIRTRDESYWRPRGDRETAAITVTFPEAVSLTHILLREQTRLSQRIEGFTIEVRRQGSRSWEGVGENRTYTVDSAGQPIAAVTGKQYSRSYEQYTYPSNYPGGAGNPGPEEIALRDTTIAVQRAVGLQRICRFPKEDNVTALRITITGSRVFPTLKYAAAYCDPE
ncbi:MAG: alpha-L-fucosidase [Treponema sp.]|jgi:alpha-L-fucosidase|nr:alpha-L-fucosidase [Treponema sp.]